MIKNGLKKLDFTVNSEEACKQHKETFDDIREEEWKESQEGFLNTFTPEEREAIREQLDKLDRPWMKKKNSELVKLEEEIAELVRDENGKIPHTTLSAEKILERMQIELAAIDKGRISTDKNGLKKLDFTIDSKEARKRGLSEKEIAEIEQTLESISEEAAQSGKTEEQVCDERYFEPWLAQVCSKYPKLMKKYIKESPEQ